MAITSVCVFLGSARGHGPAAITAARALGAGLAGRGWTLIYGGASVGLMGELAEAALAAGGEVTGVMPIEMADREIAHRGLTRLDVVASMAERKDRMFALADAFVTLPGGYGTLDELFEALTGALLGYHHKPIVLVDLDGYFAGLLRFLDDAMVAGFLRPEYRALLEVVPTPEAALELLARR
ncbi:MAG TPA: TIGR00730 family Rossman fold protein [Kofleriaceae bacterium]|nr:TIGR00730 family Rossman fold protein [Kofleriaceae bacterium]